MSSIALQRRYFTPLRYPGGKAKLAAFVKAVVEKNELCDGEYVEPYAGGAAIALEMLIQGYVSRIHINDISRPVWSFWKSVLTRTEELVRLIRNTPITLCSWDKQKQILYKPADHDVLEVGFAMFFLNRTNRSGILNGGVIGGRSQNGDWTIDARYNAKELVGRVETIAQFAKRISVTRMDANKLLAILLPKLPSKSLVYLDPPYYEKGRDLYYDFYSPSDHEEIATTVLSLPKKRHWIVSYDNVPQIRKLYKSCRRVSYQLSYSAREARTGVEAMFFSPELLVPPAQGAMSNVRNYRGSA